MRVFEWDDGFTPYSAVWDGVTLTELQECTVERVSRLVRRPAWDGHVNATDNAMTDGFASGDVDGVAVAWIDGKAFELAPSGDFDCCATGAHDVAPVAPVSVSPRCHCSGCRFCSPCCCGGAL